MIFIQTCHFFIARARSAFEVPTRPLPSDPHPHRCSFQLQPAKSSIKREYHENSRFTSLCILSNIAISSDFAEFKDKSKNESVSYLADVVGELWKSLVFWRWELSGGPDKTFWVPFFSMAPTSSSILKLTVDGRHMWSKSWTNNQQSTHMLAFIWSSSSFQVQLTSQPI